MWVLYSVCVCVCVFTNRSYQLNLLSSNTPIYFLYNHRGFSEQLGLLAKGRRQGASILIWNHAQY